MKESKRRRREPQGEDRLSELPDSLIFHIFWFIPMVDVIKTSILSKRWRNLWTTAPFLNFDDDHRETVNQCLFRWHGVRILKFRVVYEILFVSGAEIESWVKFAKEKGVEELDLHAITWCYAPQCMYSCSSLKELRINGSRFGIVGNVDWHKLKRLTITQGDGINENVINQIISGSPRLEVFNLSFGNLGQNLNIRSNSLKELSIRKCMSALHQSDLSFVSELRIWAPNLETLRMEGIPWRKCLLQNVSSLKRAALGFSGLLYDESEDDCRFPGFPLKNVFLSFRDFLGDNFIQILQIIKQVDSVALFFCCPEVLGAMKRRCTSSSFANVKSLTMRHHFNDYERFIGLLKMFPRLNSLVLEDDEHYQNKSLASETESYDPEIEASYSKPFMLQLRAVDITWSRGDSIFTFAAQLLKYANKLEKMVFRVEEIEQPSPPSNPLVVASQKLLMMPRSSKKCTIQIL